MLFSVCFRCSVCFWPGAGAGLLLPAARLHSLIHSSQSNMYRQKHGPALRHGAGKSGLFTKYHDCQ